MFARPRRRGARRQPPARRLDAGAGSRRGGARIAQRLRARVCFDPDSRSYGVMLTRLMTSPTCVARTIGMPEMILPITLYLPSSSCASRMRDVHDAVAAPRIAVVRQRHGADDVRALGVRLQLADDLEAAAGVPQILLREVPRQRVAELHHESGRHPADALTVVEVALDEREDVRDALRRFVRIGLEGEAAARGRHRDERPGARATLERGRRGSGRRRAARRRRWLRSRPAGGLRERPTHGWHRHQHQPPPPTRTLSASSLSSWPHPILGQSAAIAQSPHRGYTGRHTFCPQVTR